MPCGGQILRVWVMEGMVKCVVECIAGGDPDIIDSECCEGHSNPDLQTCLEISL